MPLCTEVKEDGLGSPGRSSPLSDAPGAQGCPLADAPHRWDGRLDIEQLDQLARKIAATYIDDLGTRAA